jgi:molecular chaperone DnaJ
VDVNYPLLCLGGDIVVPTVEGESTLTIPPGTQPGKIFRIKGLGVIKSNGYGRGDELVYLNIAIPTDLTERQRLLLQDLALEFTGNVGASRRGIKEKFKEFFDWKE